MSKGWFAGLPKALQSEFLARARRRVLAPGQRLYSRGEEADGIYGVAEGTVRVSGISREGQEIVLDFYGHGVWFGEVAALDGMPRNHDVQAYDRATVLHVSQADLEDLVATRPALARALLQLEALRLRILLLALEQYSAQSLEQRLANRLLMIAGSYGVNTPQGVKIELHLPQETLAQLIGSTRQRVNQILKEWEHSGIVAQQYGRVTLLSQSRLEQIAR
jgi:CRP-like cAMP-binding protein